MDLSANAGIVSDAMKYVTQTQEKLTTLKVLEERTTQQMKNKGKRQLLVSSKSRHCRLFGFEIWAGFIGGVWLHFFLSLLKS
jgi:hypothetical protein